MYPQPQFCYIKVGYKGVYIAWTCFPDGVRQTSVCVITQKSRVPRAVVDVITKHFFNDCVLDSDHKRQQQYRTGPPLVDGV